MLLVEQVAHKGVVLSLRHHVDVSRVQSECFDLTSYTMSAGVQDLYPARVLLPY